MAANNKPVDAARRKKVLERSDTQFLETLTEI
jgi:hypothetical protein